MTQQPFFQVDIKISQLKQTWNLSKGNFGTKNFFFKTCNTISYTKHTILLMATRKNKGDPYFLFF